MLLMMLPMQACQLLARPRIDFALHHPSLFTLKVVTERRAPLSDHALVAYDYGDNLYPPMWRAPRFPDQSSFTIFTEEQELLLDADFFTTARRKQLGSLCLTLLRR